MLLPTVLAVFVLLTLNFRLMARVVIVSINFHWMEQLGYDLHLLSRWSLIDVTGMS